MNKEISWRGSKYTLEREDSGVVYWYNSVSRYHGHCSLAAWKASEPYGTH